MGEEVSAEVGKSRIRAPSSALLAALRFAVANAMAAEDLKHQRLDQAIDQLRARYGRQVVYFVSVQDSRDAAPMRISFAHIPDLRLEQD